MIETSPSRAANIFAIAAISLMLVAFGALFAGINMGAVIGPLAVAAAPDAAFFRIGNELLRTDPEGKTTHRATLESLGLGRTTPMLELFEGTLRVADADHRRVARCDAELTACSTLLQLPAEVTSRVFHIASAPDGRLFVSSGEQHALLVIDPDGKAHPVPVAEGLRYPNTVVWLPEGMVAIADTNHHRWLVLAVARSSWPETRRAVEAHTPFSRSGRTWPTAVTAGLDGRFWVINSNGLLKKGDLLLFSPEGEPLKRVELGEEADPIALAPHADGVLVADYEGFRLHAVNAVGEVVEFGDPALRAELAALRQERERGALMERLGWGTLALALFPGIAALVLATRAQAAIDGAAPRPGLKCRPWKRPGRSSGDSTVAPDRDGIVWVGLSPEYRRRTRLLFSLIALTMLAGPLLLTWTYVRTGLDPDPKIWKAIAPAVLITVFFIGSLWRGLTRLRIGTDGTHLYLHGFAGRRVRVRPEEATLTDRRIVASGATLSLVGPDRRCLFDEAQMERYIAPLLERAARRSELGLLWDQLRQGEWHAWLVVITLLLVISAVLWGRLAAL